jgi:hypothetical protein
MLRARMRGFMRMVCRRRRRINRWTGGPVEDELKSIAKRGGMVGMRVRWEY